MSLRRPPEPRADYHMPLWRQREREEHNRQIRRMALLILPALLVTLWMIFR